MTLNSMKYAAALAVLAAATGAIAGVTSKDAAQVVAGTYELDSSHSSVAGRIDHMGFSSTTIRFARLSGQMSYDPARPEAASLDVTIDINSLSTDWDARDRELKGPGFFNAAKFPTAQFKASGLTKVDATHAKVIGTLTLMGVSKPVQMDVTLLGSGTGMMGDVRAGFEARAAIKRSDFGMKAFLPAVGDTVNLLIDAEFSRKK